MSRSRRLLLSDKARRKRWLLKRLLTDFEPGFVYTCVPTAELADIPSDVLLEPGDVHTIREPRA